ncbi:MAG: hypothetical protein AAF434_18300 [Pseudomonadota bacterium]
MYRIFSISAISILVSCGGSNGSPEDANTVTVFKSTGAIQCEHSGESVEESALLLIRRGIDVISSNCGFETNLVVLAVCGAGTTDINLHLIPRSNLPDAEELEYFDVAVLENDTTGVGYEVVDCENS